MIEGYIGNFQHGLIDAETSKNKIAHVISLFPSPVHKKQLAKYAEDIAWGRNILLPKEMFFGN